ncbi:hypothetical protein [Sphingomonas sp.]|uniref:hypothetical protein n=1 Tax=Sphingomonas sp. TaxID=28214 RepID=UPI003B3B8701
MAAVGENQQSGAGEIKGTDVVPGEYTATGPYFTELFLTGSSAAPDDTGSFVPRQTPGNVGICLSGGGSRAFSAGIGQLQALQALQANGSSLLNQTRALSTVSGGGWIGIPFIFLPDRFSDSDFLGAYVEPANLTVDGLGNLPPNGIAGQITSGFSLAALAVQALLLYDHYGVPSSELWQVLMGETFLQPYGLYVPGIDQLPTQFFSYDATSLARIRGDNPGLANENADLVASVSGQQRPYLISLCSLSVSVGSQQALLAPVHSTPFITGILASPPGAIDVNNRAVGGGAVSSFAFDSDPIPPTNSLTRIIQSSQWSLTDALGTSSAAFAETLIEHMKLWAGSPARFAAALRLHGPRAIEKVARGPEERAQLHAKVDAAIAASPAGPLAASDLHQSLRDLAILQSIVPKYQYWSPVNPPVAERVAESEFADGGSLENSGVASILSYADIDNVIAFLNVETLLRLDSAGTIVVDDCLPPLFGYQPYVEGQGYALYEGAIDPPQPVFQFNQVFSSSDFQPLLEGLWNASKNGTAAPIFAQTLTTVDNRWFNVAAGKTVTLVWTYLAYASSWFDSISDNWVRGLVDVEQDVYGFPNYDTFNTELSATQVNLLSNLTSWSVRANAPTFQALYGDKETG